MKTKSIKRNLSKIVSLLAVVAIGAPAMASIPAAAYIRDNLDPNKTWAAEYESWDAIAEAAADLNIRMAEESITLLKNKDNALPLAKNAKVTVLGRAANNLSQGGGGSGAQKTPTKGASAENNYDIYDALEMAGFEVNPAAKAIYEAGLSGQGNERGSYMTVAPEGQTGEVEFGGVQYVAEAGSTLETVEDTFAEYGDAAILVVTRTGSEFSDCGSNAVAGHSDASDHYLMLEDNEKEMLAYAKKHFKKVVLLINSPSAMELGAVEADNKIQSVVWIGQLGWNGTAAVGSILNGDVNPSGHTVDFYMSDLDTDPSTMNSLNFRRAYYAKTGKFGKSSSTINLKGADDATSSYIGKVNALDYAEGIYMGYRYYETVAAEIGGEEGETWYDENTVYSFGHGLSYTTFKQTIKEVKGDLSKADGEVTVVVEVENTGAVAGKEVVQLYATKPYTKGGIEKAAVDLVGFAKTSALAAGAKETVEITIAVKDLASFDYDDKNNNKFCGYELEAGDYVLSIRENSHDVLDSKTLKATAALTWDEDGDESTPNNIYSQPKDSKWGEFNTLAHNWTVEGEDHYLSRTDLVVDGKAANLVEQLTWMLEEDVKFVNEAFEVWGHYTNGFAYYDYDNAQTAEVEKDYNNLWNKTKEDLEGWTQGEGVKDEKGNYEILLSEMMGVPFEDEKWTTFMNQLTWQELIDAISSGKYNTVGVESINKPYVTDQDGPGQLKGNKGSGWAWVCEVNIASTWNVEIAYEQGRVVGEESMWVDSNGWYGPAMNTHRNALAGRNFEYYSQDGVQGGLIAAAVVKGAVEKGCHVYAKHTFLNDQETNRMNTCTFATEQAMREIYAKPFELVTRKGEGNGFMTAFNRIGLASSCSYATNIQLYENEWGYDGLTVTDFYSAGNSGWSGWAMARATCIPLGNTSQKIDGVWDAEKNVVVCNYKDGETFDGYTQWFWVRNTAQRIFYMAVNGNAMANGLVNIDLTSDLELTQYEAIGYRSLLSVQSRKDLMEFFGTDDYELFSVSGLPSGMSYVGNGTVTGTPSRAGTSKVTVHVGGLGEKQYLNATFYVTLTVAEGDPAKAPVAAPAVVMTQDKTWKETALDMTIYAGAIGQEFVVEPDAVANAENVGKLTKYSVKAEGLPEGLTLDAATGKVTGKATAAAGEYEVKVTVSYTEIYRRSSWGGVSYRTRNVNATGTLTLTVEEGAMGQIVIMNGFWYIDGVNTGVPVTGNDGADGIHGINGADGLPGADGKDGVGIASITITDGILTITLTDGTVVSGNVMGPAGANGANGADGAQGPAGPAGPAGADGAAGCASTVAGTAVAAIAMAVAAFVLRKKED